MKKRYWVTILILVILIITYFLGPVPPTPEYTSTLPNLPDDLKELQNYIEKGEDSMPVRKDNESRIVWQQGIPQKTEYSIVYLHGFAGSYRDGFPVNHNIADTLNANLFYSRWAGHGLKPPASLNNFTPDHAWNSAKEALIIGNIIGEKVIIMSTSTGGTLAIALAAEFPDLVFAIINMSPNLEDDQPGAFVLNSQWGYEIANLTSFGKNKKIKHEQQIARKYWDTIYPSKALVDLQALVESTMTPATFKKVKCPVLTMYYHKAAFQEDQHVEVSVYEDAHKLFETPDSLVVLKPLKTPGTHFIGSDIKSRDTEIVENSIINFLTDKLKVKIDSI